MAWRPEYMTFFFPIMGSFFFLLGLATLKSALVKIRTWKRARGTVTAMGQREGSKGKTLWYPVYRYLVDGKEYAGESDTASSPPDYAVGDAIELLVHPSRPEETAVLDRNIWLFSIVPMVLGLLVLIFGGWFCWLSITGRVK